MVCAVVKMEGAGQSAMDALSELVGAGARTIVVQPVGLPFSDSLMAWLPGALAHWLKTCGMPDVSLALATDQSGDQSVLATIAQSAVAGADEAVPIGVQGASVDGKGWDDVPTHCDHLLVCTGPRCTFRRAGLLRDVLNAELSRHGVMRRTLVATTGCLFPCNKGPVIAHYPAGRWYRLGTPDDVSIFVQTVLVERRPLTQFVIHEVDTDHACA